MCTKVRLAASMSGVCMQEFPKTLHRAQQLLRLQSAPGSLAMLAVHLQDRDHQQRGSDSRRVPRLIFRHSPKDLKRSVDGCVRPVHRSMEVWSKFGQSLCTCSQTAAKLAVPTDACRNGIYSNKLLATSLRCAYGTKIASVDV